MTQNEKALKQLHSEGQDAFIENDTVYLVSIDTAFELAEFEINYQASKYDEEHNEEHDEIYLN